MDCVFCKIIKGEIPSYTVYEDDLVKVFLDIQPNTNGHLLIIPKKHILDINDMDSVTFERILETSKKMYALLQEQLKVDGLTLVQNNGEVQEVKHYHMHLKPYYTEEQELKDVKEIYELLTKKTLMKWTPNSSQQ